jgi:hypothetical protein
MTRLKICLDCTFYKEKCTFCGCSGKGVIEDKKSRCPRNLWEDGWGIPSLVIPIPCEDIEYEVMIWDDVTQQYISIKDIKAMIEEKGDLLYVFKSEEDIHEFIRLKQMN